MENEGSSVGARGRNGVSTNAKLPFLLPFGKKASVGRGPISGVQSAKQAELDRLFALSDASGLQNQFSVSIFSLVPMDVRLPFRHSTRGPI